MQAGEAVATCPKGWDLTSWLTSTTIGGHCSLGAYTSKYDCAAQCVWFPDRLNEAQCRGVQPPGTKMETGNVTSSEAYASKLTGKCAQHLPCVKDKLDPTAPDGPCLCCHMQQDPKVLEANPRVPTGQLWTFVVSQLVFLAWMLFLVHVQLKAVHIQGTRVVGPSDFSAWITGISKSRTEDAPLAHWCGQFGPVVAAFNIPNVGDALRVGRNVAALQVRQAEAAAFVGSTSCNPMQWLYKLIAVGRPSSIDEALEREEHKLEIYERQESEPTGQGLVTFEYSNSTNTVIGAFERAPLRSLLDWASLRLTDNTPRLHGTVVKVVRAPEPSDILWEHTNCTGTPALLRRLWSWTLTALIILAGAGIQYGLAGAAERLREERMMAQYAAGTGAEWAVTEAANKSRKLRAISILSGVVVVTINLTVMVTMRALSWYERWTTRTSMERWVMMKLSVSLLCNAFAAPMLAAYATGNRSGWYSRGGLMESAFYVQCANALGPTLFNLLGLGDKLKYYILSYYARTQPMLNQLLAPPPFPMAEQHASAVTTIGLAMLYMPVLPISPIISLVGLTISYCANKWIALRRAAAPPHFSGMVTAPLNWLLRLLPLLQLVLMKQLYFKDYPAVIPVFYTGLAFWILFCLAPIRAFLGAVRRRRKPTASSGISYHKLLGGRRLGVGDVYAPLVPKACSRTFKETVAAVFAQLAPAAFETILNGEEVARFLFGARRDSKKDAELRQELQAEEKEEQDEQEDEVPELLGALQRGVAVNSSEDSKTSSKHSLRASLVAGVHGTLNLIWQPQDADHPDDEFLPPTEVLGGSLADSGCSSVGPPPPMGRPMGPAPTISGAGDGGGARGGGEGGDINNQRGGFQDELGDSIPAVRPRSQQQQQQHPRLPNVRSSTDTSGSCNPNAQIGRDVGGRNGGNRNNAAGGAGGGHLSEAEDIVMPRGLPPPHPGGGLARASSSSRAAAPGAARQPALERTRSIHPSRHLDFGDVGHVSSSRRSGVELPETSLRSLYSVPSSRPPMERQQSIAPALTPPTSSPSRRQSVVRTPVTSPLRQHPDMQRRQSMAALSPPSPSRSDRQILGAPMTSPMRRLPSIGAPPPVPPPAASPVRRQQSSVAAAPGATTPSRRQSISRQETTPMRRQRSVAAASPVQRTPALPADTPSSRTAAQRTAQTRTPSRRRSLMSYAEDIDDFRPLGAALPHNRPPSRNGR